MHFIAKRKKKCFVRVKEITDRAVFIQRSVYREKRNQETNLGISLSKICFRALYILSLYN